MAYWSACLGAAPAVPAQLAADSGPATVPAQLAAESSGPADAPARPDERPAGSATILAEQGDRLVGFVHVVFDHDPTWGSLVDNLHVAGDRKRTGLGTRLLGRAAALTTGGIYLWVLEQNSAAQQFYVRLGAVRVETATASAPGGDPANLNGTPRKHRMAWPDATRLAPARSS
ncbi:GNAT family N-acetyltransferase [Actinoplanes bogorensis]|uniref:GNAT family N-acetyltransferase n=1 Tax=Paractinoplanes bogorensis TaxID=1610840 RepID=A0ABS5YTG3_9ACTN|nr:GNAT family N-acetyltransferase [Actinoplanes bogorensis]